MHGFLILSLLGRFTFEVGLVPEGVSQVFNYGLERVRFLAPLKSGARIRDRVVMFVANPLVRPGALSLLGTPIDLARIACDTYIVAGATDHITPWKGCYSTTQVLNGHREFVLSSSGHIQAVIKPPGNAKARFFTNPQAPRDPDDWLAGARGQSGSWWDHRREWIAARSGKRRPAPKALGSLKHPPAEQAPGTYVLAP